MRISLRCWVEALREAGHDVAWIRLIAPGTSDNDVLQAAARDRRICVTFDKDFGELAAARGDPTHGVIFFASSAAANAGICESYRSHSFRTR